MTTNHINSKPQPEGGPAFAQHGQSQFPAWSTVPFYRWNAGTNRVEPDAPKLENWNIEIVVGFHSPEGWTIPSVVFRRIPDGAIFGAFVEFDAHNEGGLIDEMAEDNGGAIFEMTPADLVEWFGVASVLGKPHFGDNGTSPLRDALLGGIGGRKGGVL